MKSAITDTVAYVKLLAQNMAGLDLDCVILSILMDMAIPINYSGFIYLWEAVRMHYENPLLDLANETYLVIGTKYGGYDSDTVATYRTFKSSSYSSMMDTDTGYHSGVLTCGVPSGKYYRAKVTFYAGKDGGFSERYYTTGII